MVKNIVLTSLILSVLALPAQAVVDEKLDTPENRQILSKIEKMLDSMTTVKARFSEFSSKDGDFMKHGDFYLSRPNKMRLIYDEPVQIEFIADGQYFIYYDKDFDQVSVLEIDQTPAAILLKSGFSFDDPAFYVTDIKEELDEYHISAIKTGQGELGELTLIASQDPLELREWQLVDMKGIKSTVGLYEVQTDIDMDENLFIFKKE